MAALAAHTELDHRFDPADPDQWRAQLAGLGIDEPEGQFEPEPDYEPEPEDEEEDEDDKGINIPNFLRKL